jgi:hypothetical protein
MSLDLNVQGHIEEADQDSDFDSDYGFDEEAAVKEVFDRPLLHAIVSDHVSSSALVRLLITKLNIELCHKIHRPGSVHRPLPDSERRNGNSRRPVLLVR